ncbi:MAG TPA: MFS transporter [Dehalococcoidia bacterium]|nr:MFS transporter [Dehalococcoidia bacterium]
MAALPKPRIYRGWWIVFTGYLSQAATVGSSGWVFGVLILPMQEDLGWSRSELVGVVTLSRLISGVLAARLGPVVDRSGARSLMTLSALGAAACLLGTAASQNQWQYYLCWAGFGVCMPGLSNIGPAVAISNWFVRKRAQAVMIFTFGSATAGLVLAPVMSAVAGAHGWRAAWVAMALIFLTVAPLAWHFVRRRPEDFGLLPDGANAEPIEQDIDEAKPAPDDAEPEWTVRQALHSHSFWLVTFAFMLTSFPASSIFIHMPSFVESKGFSSGEGAAAVSFYGAGVLAGRFTWGFIVSRIGVYRALVAYGFSYGLSIFLFVAPHALPLIYATTVLLGVSIAGAQQLHVQAFPEYFGRRIVGSLLGYAGVAAALTGSAAPLLAAAAYDHSQSYSLTFSVFGAFCLIAGVAFLFSKPKAPARRPSPVTHGA